MQNPTYKKPRNNIECYDVFREKINHLCTQFGLNGSEFADRCDIAKPSLYRYLSGVRYPTIDVLLKISLAFNISVDWLLGRSEKEFMNDNEMQNSFDILMYHGDETDIKIIQLLLDKYGPKSKTEEKIPTKDILCDLTE